MTTPRRASSDDDYWRRPPAGASTAPTDGTGQQTGIRVGYTGPPPTTAPPPGWRPPVYLRPPPPRQLPAQDTEALDAAEQKAQRFTYGVAAVAGAVLVAVICVLCSRVVL